MTTFDGKTYDATRDRERLLTQLEKVFIAMSLREWWTLAELASKIGGSEAGISARIRDLRKPRWGGHKIERQRVAGGLWQYRMVKP